MPETTTKPAGTPQSEEKAVVDHLQDALEDLDMAREKAGEEAGERIDSARDRISDARRDLSDRGQEQVKDWRDQLGDAADDALRELGRWAIRAQRSSETLAELSDEISRRRGQLGS